LAPLSPGVAAIRAPIASSANGSSPTTAAPCSVTKASIESAVSPW
jgi:hypothetical protein